MWIYVWDAEIKWIYLWDTLLKEVYLWDTKIRPMGLKPWIYHNAKLWLISISTDNETRLTIFDKNLGANRVYDWGTLTNENVGYYYQFGNCFWFPFDPWFTLPQTTNQNFTLSGFSSSNYFYLTAPFHTNKFYNYSLDYWGEQTNTYIARRWPCMEWYHIPSKSDLDSLIALWTALWFTTWEWCKDYLLMPLCWKRTWSSTADTWTYGYYRSSTYSGVVWGGTAGNNMVNRGYWLLIDTTAISVTDWDSSIIWKCIRPFKNEAVVPDSDREALYTI